MPLSAVPPPQHFDCIPPLTPNASSYVLAIPCLSLQYPTFHSSVQTFSCIQILGWPTFSEPVSSLRNVLIPRMYDPPLQHLAILTISSVQHTTLECMIRQLDRLKNFQDLTMPLDAAMLSIQILLYTSPSAALDPLEGKSLTPLTGISSGIHRSHWLNVGKQSIVSRRNL